MSRPREFEKIHLSEELEELIFSKVLKQREIDALKLRCESYQVGVAREWRGDVFEPYGQYFGLLTALKVKSALKELDSKGYLDIWGGAPNQLFDFGAGTLGATLGALDFFKEKKSRPKQVHCFDQDTKPMFWSHERFKKFLGPIDFKKPSSLSKTLVVAVDVFNEMGLMDEKEKVSENAPWLQELLSWISQADESTIFLLLEPASKEINRQFLHLRNVLKEHSTILLPCTHQASCPALLTDDWCHEDRAYKTPSAYWNLVKKIGYRRNMLQFSMLALGKQGSKFRPQDARMVSRDLKSKGRSEKWLCADGKRWKASYLNRHHNEENASYYEALRGDIIDCVSTGIKRPD